MTKVLRMPRSFLRQAITRTLKGLPLAESLSLKALITGLNRMAENAAMSRVLRTLARPPRMDRFLEDWPLS